jgi:prefoldin subunit 5
VADDDDTIDRELEMVQQKIQQLQKRQRKVRSSIASEEKNL